MSVNSEYMGLKLYDPYGVDAAVESRDFYTQITGPGEDSNMSVIDAYMKGKASVVVKTAEEWAADTATILRANDFGIASDSGIVKRGDGVNTWADLTAVDNTYDNLVAAGYTGSVADFYALVNWLFAGVIDCGTFADLGGGEA